MPIRQRKIIDPVHIGVHPPGGDFVQQRLPQVRGETIDERDFGAAAFRPSLSPKRTASGKPPAPPPTMTMRCRAGCGACIRVSPWPVAATR